MNLLDRSTRVRDKLLKKAAGADTTYIRGANVIEQLRGVQSQVRQIDFGEQFELTSRERDWLFLVSDLVIDGEAILPQRDDIVQWIDADNVTHRYEVLPRAGERCYRFTDQSMLQVRVFTIEVQVIGE